ncbi:ABC transporter permease [Myroides sp. 1354]|uniref:ABC transporter permease n=1 Tax=unclassified Myroides TaxID=2642485 RepID=UPI00257539AE|nr:MULTISPECIES: ABC transporter permease [unclassified Myroides]MDM1043665.1 ABC transporter permease [Myroides sp. R163-1]MDM1054285.1 ABC transporter permease [Myroides sp. 1354]MDM1067581.1 ABC transporter permease [Myroides sp. 1372]
MVNTKVIEIQNYLPHRAPMLMVDIITAINTDSVATLFEIKADNIFLENGRFCEAGLMENAAQTCSAIVGQTFFFDENHQERQNVNVLGFISAMKKVEILGLPHVGETLFTEGKLISRMDGDDFSICLIAVTTRTVTQAVLKAEVNLFLQKQ